MKDAKFPARWIKEKDEMLPRACDKENVWVLHRIRTSDLLDIRLEALTTDLHRDPWRIESFYYVHVLYFHFISFHISGIVR